MLFPTLRFALFFFVVFFLYWYVFRRKRQRIILLTCASYFFYACWDWRFCVLLFGVSALSGLIGYLLGIQKNYIPRTVTMVTGTVLHILFLGFFKYFYDFTSFLNYTFFNGQLQTPLLLQLQGYSLLLPVGISYYTFRSMSYIFDIYLCKMRPAKSFIELLLYISFFPQLASGPIVQAEPFFTALPDNLTRDAGAEKPIDFDRSVLLIVSGLYKKMVLATFLSVLAVDPVFANPAQCNTLELLVGLVSYTFVIYCDFSGYSDMAIGIGLLLGFETPQNFNRPYISQSVSEFWRRWHISFSSWLRDYVYFSFGGSRYGLVRTVFALVGTMLIAGVWHGGSIPFVLWGLLQGLACAAERVVAVLGKERRAAAINTAAGNQESLIAATAVSDKPRRGMMRFIGRSIDMKRLLRLGGMFVFINISWLIFRANTVREIALYVTSLKNITQPFRTVHWFVLVPLAAAFLLQIPSEETRRTYFARYVRLPLAVKIAAVVLFFIALNIVSTSGVAPFIYFGF
ncbi:MBOAT family protein [Treponema vincentii]|uniref:MBOAT family O-acyltransferase n=1 Tax=Treponema vincentii TaxID=69710 RepID=UPI003D8CE3BC